MYLETAKKLIQKSVEAHVNVGKIKDSIIISRDEKDFKNVLNLKKKLKGYRDYSLHFVGAAGIGKSKGVVQAATEAGVPAIVLFPAQWADSADGVGMPKIRTINGKEVTVNLVREFFPQYKTDENGEILLRKDGGFMIDFDAIKDYIANYDEMMVLYEGDINQAPGCLIFWDEINRVIAPDVQQLLFDVFVSQKLGGYKFPNGTLMVAASNPNTIEYTVSAMMEERAFKDRFVHVEIEANLPSFNKYMKDEEFDWSIQEFVNQHPDTVNVSSEEYNMEIQSSSRSLEVLNTLKKFSTLFEKFEQMSDEEIAFVTEVVAGLIGELHAVNYIEVVRTGGERVPTGEEIIAKYEEVESSIHRAIDANRQDFMNQVKDNFLDTISDASKLAKLDLEVKKDTEGNFIIPVEIAEKLSVKLPKNDEGEYVIKPSEFDGLGLTEEELKEHNIFAMKNNKDKWVFVTKNMNNVYLFLNSIHAEFRVAIIKQLVKLETVHPLLARHQKLFDIVKKDINDSNKKK